MTAVLPDLRQAQLTFAGGLAGFPGAERYALIEAPDAAPLCLMRSVDDPDIEFVVAPPAVFFRGYEPEIDDASADRLGLVDAGDAEVFVILTLGADLADTTANLLAPVVINQRTGCAAQVVLQGDWSLRAPLLAA